MYSDKQVSLTESFRKYSEEHPNINSTPFLKDKTVHHLHDSLSKFIGETRYKAKAYHTICQVYKEVAPILQDNSKFTVYDFLNEQVENITNRLIDEKKLYGSLFEKYDIDCLKQELAEYAEEDFIQRKIPSKLSYLANGKFAKHYEEAVKSIDEGKPNSTANQTIESYASMKEDAIFTLESLERGWDLLAEDEWELAEKEVNFDIMSDEVTEEYLHDRVLRVYLLIESYRRLCVGEELKDSIQIRMLMEILGVHLGG